MKKILIFGLLIFSMSLYAQDFPISEKTGKVTYESVVKVDGASASELYVRANEWFLKKSAKTLNSADAVIQKLNKEKGKIIGKGYISVSRNGAFFGGGFNFTITVTAKEGRYRYIITDIEHYAKKSEMHSGGAIENEKPACGTFFMLKRHWRNIKKQAHEGISVMYQDLVQYMSETNSEEDDW